MLVTIYQNIWNHITENTSLHSHLCENLRPHSDLSEVILCKLEIIVFFYVYILMTFYFLFVHPVQKVDTSEIQLPKNIIMYFYEFKDSV